VWPFKKKEKKWKPRSWIDYTVLGLIHRMELRKKIGKIPVYKPSEIIQKQLKQPH